MGQATEEQLNNPLHGVKLIQILEELIKYYGWEKMAQEVSINCFKLRPSVKSSLSFLRKTDWARSQVEDLYLKMLEDKANDSVEDLWNNYISSEKLENTKTPDSWYFCDKQKDADECAELVLNGIKKATSTSLWWFEYYNEDLPKVGDLNIITNWRGIAKAVIKTTKVEQVPFNKITEEYAVIEGEGDKSLEYWNKIHLDYYSREMQKAGEKPAKDMLIVCEQFEVIYK